MKKLLAIVLAAALLLGGCANTNDPDNTDTEQPSVEATSPGLYIPESQQEKESNGSVRRYDLPGENYHWLAMLNDKLLVATTGAQTTLTLLSGNKCTASEPVCIDEELSRDQWQLQSTGIAYYSKKTGQMVYLDNQLKEYSRVTLPEDLLGLPVVSPDGNEIFYTAGQELRVLDIKNGITRMLKSHTCTSMELQGSYFNGDLLACQASYEDGSQNTLYISAKNGQTLHTYDYITTMDTLENRFFAQRDDGTVEQIFFGNRDETPLQLNVADGRVAHALELNGAVEYTQTEEGNLNLSFYDLTSGLKTSAVSLSGVGMPKAILADKSAGCVWVLAPDKETDVDVLLQWNIDISAVAEETVYTGTFFTSKNPDNAGIKACKTRANKIAKAHGIKIRLWEYGAKYTGGHEVVAEHQPEAIKKCLDDLATVLKEFPEDFVEDVISNGVRVCIVRSIDGEQKSVQFWEGSSFFILISAGADVREGFISCLGYVVDTHILGNTARYDYWKPLNPEGFDYADPTTHLDTYLIGDQRAFIDAISMTSIVEDRSRVFYQALLPDNAETFKSETMQKKLRLLCKGIRNAWDWRRVREDFPWEQYLNESIAYK